MEKLISGIHTFRSEVFQAKKQLFATLGKGQKPETLFITCSDSRIAPSLLTQTEPGEMFIIRNAGNLVAPYPTDPCGESASVEYAIKALGVKDIVVCGHTKCGAMCQLLKPQPGFPEVDRWLRYASDTRKIIDKHYSSLSEESQAAVAVEENVLVQLDHLRTHPAVSEALKSGSIKLHGWVYQIETGKVFTYDPDTQQYVIL